MKTSILTALQGVIAAQERLNKSAHNIANINTENFMPLKIHQESKSPAGVKAYTYKSQTQKDTSIINEKLDEITSLIDVKANISIIKAADDMIGKIVDLKK